jgi:CheY-like chemotaxis protein
MLRQKRLLIVEDEEDWHRIFHRLLGSEEGYHVDTAKSPAEARHYLQNHVYHLLILDICLDNANCVDNDEGMELLASLNQSGALQALKVVVVSAHGTVPRLRESFRDYKVVDFVFKLDFDHLAFMKLIREIFNEHISFNPNLAIQWPGSDTLVNLAELMVSNDQLNGGALPDVDRLHEELDHLLCQLFSKEQSLQVVSIETVAKGLQHLRIHVTDSGGNNQKVLVKIGPASVLEDIYRTDPHLLIEQSNTLISWVRSIHLGALALNEVAPLNP